MPGFRKHKEFYIYNLVNMPVKGSLYVHFSSDVELLERHIMKSL